MSVSDQNPPFLVRFSQRMMATNSSRIALILIGVVLVPALKIMMAIRNSGKERVKISDRILFESLNTDARGETEALEAQVNAKAQAGDWEGLDQLVSGWDDECTSESGGYRYTQRATPVVIGPFAEPLESGDCAAFPASAIDYNWLEEIELAFAARPGNRTLGACLALAHKTAAWARRGGDYADQVTEEGWEGYQLHMERAQEVLAECIAHHPQSAMLARLHAHSLVGAADADREVIEAFEHALALDPTNWNFCSAFGFHLLPRWYGDYDQLDIAARRHLAATEADAGAAAYAAFYMEALERDPGCFLMIDTDLFKQGVLDLLTHVGSGQRLVNYTLATLSLLLAPRMSDHREGWEGIPEARAALYPVVRAIMEDHLTCIMPQFWANGENQARIALWEAFDPEIRVGMILRVTEDGIQLDESEQDAS